MMTSRMDGSGCAALRRGAVAGLFLGLAFTAGAASGGDNAAWVSYSGVPSAMHPGDTATVTVTMSNTGTTTWQTTVVTETDDSTQTTTRTRYSLDAVGHGWGVSGVAVSGSVAPNATRSFEFTITAPETAGSYTFRWRMSRTTVVTDRPIHARSTPGTSFGAATPSQTIQVARDTAPSFGNLTIPDQEWLRGSRIEPVTLPEATGGNGALSYSLACYLPGGMTYDRARKRISGTPRTAWGPTDCTWKVTDSDDNTAASDADTEEFTIWVRRPALVLSTASLTVKEGKDETFTVKLAARPTGNVTVAVTSADEEAAGPDPASLTFTTANYASTQTVTVTGVEENLDFDNESTSIGLSASGGGYNGVSASVAVTVIDNDDDGSPTFGNQTIPDQDWVKDSRITPVTLPKATGGNGTLSYALSCSLPRGIARNSFRISGTPRTVGGPTTCTWSVTDSDGNTSASDADTETFTIEVVPDTPPVFDWTVGNQVWVEGTPVAFTLPSATGGNGTLTYALSCSLPRGIARNSFRISGTPRTVGGPTTCTWSVTDSDGNTSASDADTETFTIEVVPPDTPPVFSRPVDDLEWVQGTAIAPVTLPGATGGNGDLTYALSPSPPAGVTFSPSTRTLSGTPTATQGAATYTYTVTDSDGNTAASDADAQQFTITIVEADTAPVFSETAGDLEWVQGTAIAPVVLPEATGGNGDLTYALSPSPLSA